MVSKRYGWSALPQQLKKQRPPFLWVTTAVVVLSAGLAIVSSSLDLWFAQLAFLPILLAAAFFGLSGGLVVGLLLALISGLQLDVGPSEGLIESWVRSTSYLVFGLIAGGIFHVVNDRFKKVYKRARYLSELYTKMLSSLANTVEVRDRHTQGHCERVAKNARVMGKYLGLSKDQQDTLYWSALLHDLGKIAIPEYILQKDSGLTVLEYAEVKRHADYGANLLASVSSEFVEIADIVRSHHERYDGNGYPNNLKADEIPLAGRIISIIDVFEALTSCRPYRQPMRPADALDYIKANAGKQFDPELVGVFETCYVNSDICCSPEADLESPFNFEAHPPLQAVGTLVTSTPS